MEVEGREERAPRINDFCHWQKKRRSGSQIFPPPSPPPPIILEYCRRPKKIDTVVAARRRSSVGGVVGGGSNIDSGHESLFLFGWQHQSEFLVNISGGKLFHEGLTQNHTYLCSMTSQTFHMFLE